MGYHQENAGLQRYAHF